MRRGYSSRYPFLHAPPYIAHSLDNLPYRKKILINTIMKMRYLPNMEFAKRLKLSIFVFNVSLPALTMFIFIRIKTRSITMSVSKQKKPITFNAAIRPPFYSHHSCKSLPQ